MVKSHLRANRTMTWDRATEVLRTMHITGIHSVSGSYRFCCWLYSLILTFSRLPPTSYHHLSPLFQSLVIPTWQHHLFPKWHVFWGGGAMFQHASWSIQCDWISPFSSQFSGLDTSDSFGPSFGSCGETTTACPVLWLCLPWTGGPELIFIVSLKLF